MRVLLEGGEDRLASRAPRGPLACAASDGSGRSGGGRMLAPAGTRPAPAATARGRRVTWSCLGDAGGPCRSVIYPAEGLGDGRQPLVFGEQRAQLAQACVELAPDGRQ